MATYRKRTRTIPVPHPLRVWTAWVAEDGSEHEIDGPFPVLAIRVVEAEVERTLQSSLWEEESLEEADAVDEWLEKRLDLSTEFDPRIYLLVAAECDSPWIQVGGLSPGDYRAFFSYSAAEQAVKEVLERIARRRKQEQ